MAKRLYAIVEGDGETSAVPALMRRLLHEQFLRYDFGEITPLNAHGRGNLIKVGGLERFLELLRRRPDCSAVLILVDCESDHSACPLKLVEMLARRTAALNLPFPAAIVVAVCEYESWFLANLDQIAPLYFKDAAVRFQGNPEQKCGAKDWLKAQMPSGKTYKETQDQVKMTQHINLAATMQQLRSFRRMVHALQELLDALDRNQAQVTPQVML